MPTQRQANIAFAILILAGCAYFAWVAQGFEATGLLASSGLPSRFFPQLLLTFVAVCAAGVLATYAVRGSAGDDEGETVFASPVEGARGLATLGVAVAGYWIWSAWGYVAMAAFLAPAACLAMGVRNPVIYAVVCLLFGAVYLVFTQTLGTRL